EKAMLLRSSTPVTRSLFPSSSMEARVPRAVPRAATAPRASGSRTAGSRSGRVWLAWRVGPAPSGRLSCAKRCQTPPVTHHRWEGGYLQRQHGGGPEGEACLPLLPLKHVDATDGRVGAHPAPVVLGQRHPGGRHLARAATSLKLPGQLDDLCGTGRSHRVTARYHPSARIDGQLPTKPRDPVTNQASGFPLPAQPQLPVQIELGYRRGVVELDHVDVLEPRARRGLRIANGSLHGAPLSEGVSPYGPPSPPPRSPPLAPSHRQTRGPTARCPQRRR